MNAFAGTSRSPARRVEPQHRPWTPWGYQARGVTHLVGNGAAALFLDPGLGKTAITLAAFSSLKERGLAERMLVVAPLRVCQLVWRQEGQKWSQFRELTFSLLHGTKKAERLKDRVDIHLINPEGIPWLAQQLFGRSLPWDTVTADELTKWKNPRAPRSKKLRKLLQGAARRWGLTGSPAPNGYMDLFGQMMMLDDGAALGRYITHYRDMYFMRDFNGYDWTLRSGMAERIEERIAPYVLRMAAADYLDLPPVRDNLIEIDLPPDVMRRYLEMERDMVLSLPEGIVTGANAGAVYSKLAQMANGAVYLSGEDRQYAEVHSAKLDALEDLIEELSGQPLLVAYEFQHDLERIRKRLGADTPTLSGLSEKRITELERAWNRGEIPVLLAHPASVAHGLNLQGAGAAHVCWFSRPWDLELYEQFIRRIHRQGSTAAHITNHALQVRGTIDEVKGQALTEKDLTQQGLLRRLNAEILRDEPASTAAKRAAPSGENIMGEVRKLGFRNDAAGAALNSAGAAPVRPKGWGPPAAEDAGGAKQSAYEDFEQDQQERVAGAAALGTARGGAPAQSARRAAPPAEEPVRPKGWGPPAGAAVDPQREEIRSKISAPPVEEIEDDESAEDVPASVRALQAFPADLVQQLDGDDEDPADAPQAQHTAVATSAAPQQPRGWATPAAHAPAETEDVLREATERAESEGASWAGVSSRTRNALISAGLTSAWEAWKLGKAELVANVPRFGDKGWAELDALFGLQAASGVGAMGGNRTAPDRDEAENTFRSAEIATGMAGQLGGFGSGFQPPEMLPFVRINIEVTGLDRVALYALFSGLASNYREG